MDLSSLLSNPLVELALSFADGLLFGLGIKKGVWSVLLIVLAVLLGEYINYSVLPKSSLSSFETNVKVNINFYGSAFDITNGKTYYEKNQSDSNCSNIGKRYDLINVL